MPREKSNFASKLNVRWLGKVPYREALAVQNAMFKHSTRQHLLMLEHPHVFTYGPNADLEKNLKCDPQQVGAELVKVNRGGDVTYHGPGQLVVYPILNLASKHGANGPADMQVYVFNVEQLVIDTLVRLGVQNVGRLNGYPGVWVDVQSDEPKKICAIGVRVSRGRTMHGFALNVSTDLSFMREHIVPCGISEHDVTSLHELGFDVTVQQVADLVSVLAAQRFAGGEFDRHDVAWSVVQGDEQVGRETASVQISARKPEWLRPHVNHGPEVLATKKTLRDLNLVTVCEEAGCPNLSECWADGTATMMVLGERCTRACGFCLIDTRKPLAPDANEPLRVAQAVAKMKLEYAVLTMVARDDLADGGMGHVAQCIREIRIASPSTRVETLISDAKGTDALETLFAERPDVLNHNIETVARLQREVRPSAGYARSLSVLSRANAAGLVTKSGFMLGLGETKEEVEATLIDLAAVGVQIVTIGQYLRPSIEHLPVARWADPAEFDFYKQFGESLGIKHVEASPLTRSSYHAKQAAESTTAQASGKPVVVRLAQVGSH
ncbi:MAG: lipoyl synthase [Actinomycetota bacterium]|nr:lipoyl synthase [Actinomycetota bacterium]